MSKKILIINSNIHESLKPLSPLVEEMISRGFKFEIWSNNHSFLDQFSKEKNIFLKKYNPILKIEKNKLFFFIFVLLIPFLFIYYSIIFKLKVSKKGFDAILCLGMYEKIIFSLTNVFFKKKIIFIELPRENFEIKCKMLKKMYKNLSKKATVVALNNYTFKNLTAQGINSSLINLSVKPKSFARQENIFSNLAKVNQENSELNKNKRFFTIGTITNLNNKQNIEILLSAAKKCLSVISNLQIIIVGEGEEKKNLNWIAKKMSIENLVWFVGKQKHNKKWLDNFDIYVITDDFMNLDNSFLCLEALDSSLPLVGPQGIGAEDLIKEGKNGYLLDFNDSENLAQKLIKLNQKKYQTSKFADSSKELIDKSYNIANMANKFEEVLN